MVQRRRTTNLENHLNPKSPTSPLAANDKQATGSASHEATLKYSGSLRILEFLSHHSTWVKPGLVALVPTVVAATMKWYLINRSSEYVPEGLLPNTDLAYSSLSWVLGIVLVFRTGQAYSRYWDAVKGLHAMRVELFDACAQIVSFAESSDASRHQIDAFQLAVIRLFSLLHGVALQRVAELPDEDIQVIDQGGLDTDQMKFMCGHTRKARPEIVMQWVLRTLTEAVKTGIIDTPAPIVSRVYQELNSGFCALAQMAAIADIPFPIPYAKMVWLLLGAHITITPFYAVAFTNATVWAGLFAFVAVFSTWCIQFIGNEMEMPFGDNADDLDLASAQNEFNDLLLSLFQLETQWTPSLEVTSQQRRKKRSISLSRLRTGFFIPGIAPEADAQGTRQRADGRRPPMTLALPIMAERDSVPSLTEAIPSVTVAIPSVMERSENSKESSGRCDRRAATAPAEIGKALSLETIMSETLLHSKELRANSIRNSGSACTVEEIRNSKGGSVGREENDLVEVRICNADSSAEVPKQSLWEARKKNFWEARRNQTDATPGAGEEDSQEREGIHGTASKSSSGVSSEDGEESLDRDRIPGDRKLDVDHSELVLPTPIKLLRGCNMRDQFQNHSTLQAEACNSNKRHPSYASSVSSCTEVSCGVDEAEREGNRRADELPECSDRKEKVPLTIRQRELTSKILQSNEHCLHLFASIANESVATGAKVSKEAKLSF